MSPVFIHIPSKTNPLVTEYLQGACAQRGIEYREITPESLHDNISTIPENAMVYRSDTTRAGWLAEQLISAAVHIVTVHRYAMPIRSQLQSHITCAAYNIPMPKTETVFSTSPNELQQVVDSVGGFPLILKRIGGSHGVGVIKIDSMGGLASTLDVLLSEPGVEVIARQFVETSTHARLVVVGDRVIDSIEYQSQGDDFRTNTGVPTVVPKTYPQEIQDLAVAATHAQSEDFAGVDIIFDTENNPYVLEINSPCNFARTQMTTGVDNAAAIVDYLLAKQKQ